MTSKPNTNGSVNTSGSDQSEAEEVPSNLFVVVDDVGEVVPHADAMHLNSFLQRESKRVARNPCTYMCTSIFVALTLSAVGLIVGEFSIEVENEGWWSRGTIQSDRQRQANLARNQRFNLAYNESAWDILTNPDLEQASYEYLLYSSPTIPDVMQEAFQGGSIPEDQEDNAIDDFMARSLRSVKKMIEEKVEREEERRRLDEDAPSTVLSGCDLDFYGNLSPGNLWPVWRIPDKEYETTDTRSVLDADILESICLAELNTQKYLEDNGYCNAESRGCDSGKCIPPYSIVFYARLIVEGALDAAPDGGYAMDCKDLSAAWTSDTQEHVRDSWIEEIADLKVLLTPGEGEKEDPEYPYGYYPALVQSDFDTNGGRSQYSSSVFDTYGAVDGQELLDSVDSFDRAEASDGVVLGAYDTEWEAMGEIFTDSLVASDMTLALASSVIICIAIMLHTQSPLITGLGLLQIILSFPMGYFFYSLIMRYTYFPFLNFIGVFVVFALGAGDIYVAFDKWTNYRKNNMTKSTEYVAAYALPEALGAMFLTTLTTALAFFATAVCPVAPIKMFAIFCGLLIIFDYVLTVCFVFPGLCIYDRALIRRAAGKQTAWYSGCWMGCIGCGTCFSFCSKTHVYDDVVVEGHGSTPSKKESDPANEDNDSSADFDGKNYNGTQRLMLKLSDHLHRARWPLLVVSMASLAVCTYYAMKLSLPDSSDVRLMRKSIQYEQSYIWRKELLSTSLSDLAGSRNSIVFGIDPADTGIQTDPYSGTSLVLDETFDPSSEEAQLYLRDFCDNLYEEDFAYLPDDTYVCPMNKFDLWLKSETLKVETMSELLDPAFTDVCGSPNGLPVPSDKFHDCISTWALKYQDFDILSRDGIVKYMRIAFRNKAVFTDSYDILQEQWDAINDYLSASNEIAPEGVNKAYSTGLTFHWHDTNGSIFKTAYGAAGIALAASAVIILFSSHSVVLTLFSTLTILYILMSVTAILVGLGWTLGFLESICFSILIGVSVDFVIHFNHAYVHHKGDVPRKDRSKYAMVTMGPSILATAATTFFSAIVMLFCTITFFNKFALVLFFTIIMATLASFVVFITLTNCFGPTNPTYLVDKCISYCGIDVAARSQGGDENTEMCLTASKVRSLEE